METFAFFSISFVYCSSTTNYYVFNRSNKLNMLVLKICCSVKYTLVCTKVCNSNIVRSGKTTFFLNDTIVHGELYSFSKISFVDKNNAHLWVLAYSIFIYTFLLLWDKTKLYRIGNLGIKHLFISFGLMQLLSDIHWSKPYSRDFTKSRFIL